MQSVSCWVTLIHRVFTFLLLFRHFLTNFRLLIFSMTSHNHLVIAIIVIVPFGTAINSCTFFIHGYNFQYKMCWKIAVWNDNHVCTVAVSMLNLEHVRLLTVISKIKILYGLCAQWFAHDIISSFFTTVRQSQYTIHHFFILLWTTF